MALFLLGLRVHGAWARRSAGCCFWGGTSSLREMMSLQEPAKGLWVCLLGDTEFKLTPWPQALRAGEDRVPCQGTPLQC